MSPNLGFQNLFTVLLACFLCLLSVCSSLKKTQEDSVVSLRSQVSPKLNHRGFLIPTTRHDKGYKYFQCNYELHLHTQLRVPQDNFTLLCFSVSRSPSKLEKPIDIEFPLTAKGSVRVPCEARREGGPSQAQTRRAVLRSWT